MRTGPLPLFVGIILLSFLAGCVGGPSWNRTSRHSKPSCLDPVASLGAESGSLSEKPSKTKGRSKIALAGNDSVKDEDARLTNPRRRILELPDVPEDDDLSQNGSSLGKPLSGGQFDVPSSLPRRIAEPIEAPAPKRRSSATASEAASAQPRELIPQQDARAMPTNGFDSTVVLADYQSNSTDTNIQQVADSRSNGHSVSESANPWNQLRGRSEHANNRTGSFGDAALPQIVPGQSAFAPTIPSKLQAVPQWNPAEPIGNAANNSRHRPNDPSPWPNQATARTATAPTQSEPMNGSLTMPQEWRRDPIASNSSNAWATSNPTTATFNQHQALPNNAIQLANAEQAASQSGLISGFTPPVVDASRIQVTPSSSSQNSQIPGFNYPVNANSLGQMFDNSNAGNSFPAGLPQPNMAVTSAIDLDRLIALTGLEIQAMTPGNSEPERLAFLRKHVHLRLLQLMAGQTDKALQPVPGVDSVDQEFWQQMLWGVANYFDSQGMPDSSERATQTIAQLQTAALRLQEKARLELHNVAFCHKIIGFGNFQRFKRDEFAPGCEVLLYAEVTNFKSEPTPDGQHRTLMKSLVEVLEGGPRGRVIESIPFPPPEDRCRNQRHDYFHSYEFTIPQSCHHGPHTLRLTVEDQLGKKTTIATLNFTVQ